MSNARFKDRVVCLKTNTFVCLSLRLLRLLLCLCLVVFNGLQNTAMMLIRIISRVLNIGFYSFMIDCPPHSTPCALESRESSSLLNPASARQSGTQPDIPLSSIFNAMDFVWRIGSCKPEQGIELGLIWFGVVVVGLHSHPWLLQQWWNFLNWLTKNEHLLIL